MKYTLYIIGIISGMLTACGEDFLDLAPISQTNVKNFYRNASDMQVAVNAAYDALQDGGQYETFHYLTELRSDNTMFDQAGSGGLGFDIVLVDQFSETATNSIISNFWRSSYQGIARCNIVIDRIDNIEMEQALKERLVGEVQFLRALMYFNLVRTFGDIPLVLHEVSSVEEGYDQLRVPVAQVYEQIVTDLQEAAPSLPTTYPESETGRVTQGAAKALLGKVYLTTQDFPAAENTLKEVIDLGVYELLPEYASFFGPENENNKESIFEVQYKGLVDGSPYPNRFAPGGDFGQVTGVGAGNLYNQPTQDIVEAYEPADLRFGISLDTGYTNLDDEYVRVNYTKKYLTIPASPYSSDVNWPVLRYADVLLMYAEALNENGKTPEAYTYLNQIRSRAGLTPLPVNSAEAFRLDVEQERRIEMAFENHRWFDLLRTGRALEVMNAKGYNLEAYQLLFPIPQGQIDVNPDGMMQNPGYN